jgi:hypothetical protein
MLFWPVVTIAGFLVLTALVILLGTGSTRRYEHEQRTGGRLGVLAPDAPGRNVVAELQSAAQTA